MASVFRRKRKVKLDNGKAVDRTSRRFLRISVGKRPRYTHIFKGQESRAVAGLPDLSLPGKDSRKAVATGTDNESVDTVQNSPEKWTPFLTPTAFTGCNQSVIVGNEPDNLQENGSSDKDLNSRELSNKKNSLSATDSE